MIRKNITISTECQKKLTELKIKTGLTESDIIRRAVEIYFKEEIK